MGTMNRTMVNGPQPARWRFIVCCPGGIDKAQRRRLEGSTCRRKDDRWLGTIARLSGVFDAACRGRAFDERLRINTVAAFGSVSRSVPPGILRVGTLPFATLAFATLSIATMHALAAPDPANRQSIHGDADRGAPPS